MREFNDASLDIDVRAERPFQFENQSDLTNVEVQEQSEEQAALRTDLSDKPIEVPEQTEAEADYEYQRNGVDEGENVPEEGHDIPEGGIHSSSDYRDLSQEIETVGGEASDTHFSESGEVGIHSEVLDQTVPEDEEGMDSAHGDVALESVSTSSKQELHEAQDMSEVQAWLGDINPNFDEFDPESPYCNNCGSCALAVYQRLEGDADSCASAENIGYNEEMEAITGMEQVSMDPSEIERRLLEEGDSAHAIIGIDRAEGTGHWFNAACIDGQVVAIDGQTGEISEWPPDYGDVVNWEMSVKKKQEIFE